MTLKERIWQQKERKGVRRWNEMRRMIIPFALGVLLVGLYLMPPVTAEAAGRSVAITSAQISGSDVLLSIAASQIPSTDDGKYYIYADEVWQDGTAGALVATVKTGKSVSAGFPLKFNEAGSNLSRKFIVAVKKNGKLVQVSDEHYITNPEACATAAGVRNDHGIKGLLADPERLYTGEIEDLGIEQVTYNINVGGIVGETDDPAYPTTYFTYNGQTYAFNTAALLEYDNLFQHYTNLGLQITVNLLNDKDSDAMDLIHPKARDSHVCPGYAFNTAEQEGSEHLEAIAYFLGSRYSGGQGYGQVDNWIVGNEVNARTEWYYTSSTDLDENVNNYHKAFRVFYNGLKAGNATCRVYNSIDQEWGRKSNPGCFLSKEYLDRFNYYVNREGNIDWGLSFHPYDSPLYDPYAWLGLERWVHKDVTTPYITMQNLYILTDYMHQSEFLSPSGEVRSISLSEIGFTSYFGDDLQCASVAYGYLQAAANPDIDSFMLYRQTDHAKEIESRIAQGLVDVNGNKKPAYDYYKYIDTDQAQVYKDKASAIMGMDIDALIGNRDFPTRTWTGYSD